MDVIKYTILETLVVLALGATAYVVLSIRNARQKKRRPAALHSFQQHLTEIRN